MSASPPPQTPIGFSSPMPRLLGSGLAPPLPCSRRVQPHVAQILARGGRELRSSLVGPSLKAQPAGRTRIHPMEVALRWLHEQGTCFVAKSYNRDRLKQNMEIFDWELTEEDKATILQIPQRRACHGEFFVSPDGPNKSLDELWDGEI